MFHNPFNSKVVADITKFLNEHRNDIKINSCLNDHAKKAAEEIYNMSILEDRRSTLTTRFNEAVAECGCRGTNIEANEFSKAVDFHAEAIVPGKKVSGPTSKDSDLARMGTKVVVPGTKLTKPTAKTDISNMGKKAVVPGTNSTASDNKGQIADMGKTPVVPAAKTAEPSHKKNELKDLGTKVVVPAGKTPEPSPKKGNDLSKVGRKIVVPGK